MENKPKVFVVDDDEDMLFVTSAVLAANGYTVETAKSGREALANIDRVKPDLIILDVMMEDCAAGFRVVNQLRDSRTEGFHPGYDTVPILMLTSVQQHLHLKLDQHARTSLMNVDKFVEKPIEPRRLVDAVAGLLAG